MSLFEEKIISFLLSLICSSDGKCVDELNTHGCAIIFLGGSERSLTYTWEMTKLLQTIIPLTHYVNFKFIHEISY